MSYDYADARRKALVQEIAALKAKRDRLRAALEEIASYGENEFDGDYVAIARRALEEK